MDTPCPPTTPPRCLPSDLPILSGPAPCVRGASFHAHALWNIWLSGTCWKECGGFSTPLALSRERTPRAQEEVQLLQAGRVSRQEEAFPELLLELRGQSLAGRAAGPGL